MENYIRRAASEEINQEDINNKKIENIKTKEQQITIKRPQLSTQIEPSKLVNK